MEPKGFQRKLTTILSANVAGYSRPTSVVPNAASLIHVGNFHPPTEFPAHPKSRITECRNPFRNIEAAKSATIVRLSKFQ
jgi:hypothetical protein